jgi:hypothetical protein
MASIASTAALQYAARSLSGRRFHCAWRRGIRQGLFDLCRIGILALGVNPAINREIS